MKTEDVRKLPPLNRFLYWVGERHRIHLKRAKGKPKPWTDDEVLQRYFFTNPYREHDKVTVWFRDNVRNPWRLKDKVILATVIFRWFNFIPTGEILIKRRLLDRWDHDRALGVLRPLRDEGQQTFTGAFMINSPGGEPKLEAICRRIDQVWKDRKNLVKHILRATTLREAHQALTRYEGLGGFMAYEVVCDLRFTAFLAKATDVDTWCNPGPGAIRGLCRVLELPFEKGKNASSPPRPKDWEGRTAMLLRTMRRKYPSFPVFEMREVEHSLCEWDKYERLLWGDGRSKRTYKGV